MVKNWDFDRTVRCSSFETPEGAEEYFLTFSNLKSKSFNGSIVELSAKYQSTAADLGLSDDTVVFSRLHLSDIINQKDLLVKSELFQYLRHGVISVIEQHPLTDDFLVLFSYHVKPKAGRLKKEFLDEKTNPWHKAITVQGKHYSMLWSSDSAGAGPIDSKQQTNLLLKSFSTFLGRNNLNMRNNLVRTWIFVRDVDNHYAGMVEARKEFFHSQGLCGDSRFVASTGIEGRGDVTGSLVTMDSLSLGNIDEEQISKINAPDHLPPTMLYGVTFERGLKVRFGGRSHLMISGTASIDADGKVAHEGDIEKQALRTIDNVEALLRGQGANLSDMAYVLCYMRNHKDFDCVQEILESRLSKNIPIIAVEAAVCRPAWLFEMEGLAIVADSSRFPPFM